VEDLVERRPPGVLRHTCASALLEDGVSIKALADYLGHADPGLTLWTCTHLMPTTEDRARDAIDRALTRPDSNTSNGDADSLLDFGGALGHVSPGQRQ